LHGVKSKFSNIASNPFSIDLLCNSRCRASTSKKI